jgi:hypothetical protein
MRRIPFRLKVQRQHRAKELRCQIEGFAGSVIVKPLHFRKDVRRGAAELLRGQEQIQSLESPSFREAVGDFPAAPSKIVEARERSLVVRL